MTAPPLVRQIFDRSFWLFTALAAASGIACYLVKGAEVFFASFRGDLELFIMILPKLGPALLIAGFLQRLVPRNAVATWMGERAGFKGVVIASGIGMVTPGGPMTSFPLVNALQAAGTGRSALVAYLTSWSTLGFQRILVWEVPLMGVEFAVVRFLASLPGPLAAGLIARIVPISTAPAGDDKDG